jgi:hypothetical protein
MSWRDVGIVPIRGQQNRLFGGAMLGFGSLACLAVIILAAHGRQFSHDLTVSKLAVKLAGALATAVVVAVLEELLFRGALFGSLRKVFDWRVALVISSMVYAIVHFLQKGEISGAITWHSGLDLLPQKLAGFGDLNVVIPGFFNLTLAGSMLALAYQRTGNLYFSMGLHAGWIFWLKFYGAITSPAPAASPWIWGSEKLVDGWLALVVLAVALWVLNRWLPPKPKDLPA